MWLEEQPNPVLAGREAIRAHLLPHHPGPMSYAELNCPNSGLAFAELDAHGPEANRQPGRRRFTNLRRVYGAAGLARKTDVVGRRVSRRVYLGGRVPVKNKQNKKR